MEKIFRTYIPYRKLRIPRVVKFIREGMLIDSRRLAQATDRFGILGALIRAAKDRDGWTAGAVLMGEVIAVHHRGKAVGEFNLAGRLNGVSRPYSG